MSSMSFGVIRTDLPNHHFWLKWSQIWNKMLSMKKNRSEQPWDSVETFSCHTDTKNSFTLVVTLCYINVSTMFLYPKERKRIRAKFFFQSTCTRTQTQKHICCGWYVRNLYICEVKIWGDTMNVSLFLSCSLCVCAAEVKHRECMVSDDGKCSGNEVI